MIFAGAPFEVAALENIANREADAVEEAVRDREQVAALEMGGKIQLVVERRFLEKRILVVPGTQFLGGDAEARRQASVYRCLGLAEWLIGLHLEVVEQAHQLRLVDLLQRQMHGVEVPVPQRTRSRVAALYQLEKVVCDARRYLLRCLPRRLATVLIGLCAENCDDVVVGDLTAFEGRAEVVELGLDLLAAPDQVVDDILGELVGAVLDVEQL